ncbi:MAG TPA: hypothetical protein VJW20_06465 [Candidatus Angelobacter sp.]|nr:hypothetical protein [Candidatus Angelobacter sp.]
MIKLYKRSSKGSLSYREAWIDKNKVVEHWGKVGTRGECKTHKMPIPNKEQSLESILQSARQAGFAEIDLDKHRKLIVEYGVHDMVTVTDLDKRSRLEERLNNDLGWTGLGMCDGGSIGSGSMEVCCFVVDFALARAIVESSLAGTEFADYTRIYDEDVK